MVKNLKIKIYGKGGQGVLFLADSLGNILLNTIFTNISIYSDYDTVARGGTVSSEIILSNEKIFSPVLKDADYSIILADTEEIVISKKYIIEEKIYDQVEKRIENVDKKAFVAKDLKIFKVPFERLFKNSQKKHLNDIVLDYFVHLLEEDFNRKFKVRK